MLPKVEQVIWGNAGSRRLIYKINSICVNLHFKNLMLKDYSSSFLCTNFPSIQIVAWVPWNFSKTYSGSVGPPGK